MGFYFFMGYIGNEAGQLPGGSEERPPNSSAIPSVILTGMSSPGPGSPAAHRLSVALIDSGPLHRPGQAIVYHRGKQ